MLVIVSAIQGLTRNSEAQPMKCPGCGEWVPSTLDTCPKCNFDLTILQVVVELHTSVRRTRTDFDNIASRIRDLEDQVSSLEPLLVSKLAPPSAAPAAPDEYTPRDADAPPHPVQQ